MSKLTKTEKIKLYGLPLCDFLNSPTPTEAYFTLIETIHKLFNYSDDFVHKVKKNFPEPLNKHEIAFLKFVRVKHRLMAFETDLFGIFPFPVHINEYNIEKEEVVLVNLNSEEKFIFDLNCNNIKLDSDEMLFRKKAKAVIEIEKRIIYMHSAWDDIDYHKFGLPADIKFSLPDNTPPVYLGAYYYLSFSASVHNQIKEIQRMLSSIMMCIIKGKSLDSNEDFKTIFSNDNKFEQSLDINNDYLIFWGETPFFSVEEEFFIIKKIFHVDGDAFNGMGDNPAYHAISYLLIKFLMLPDSAKLIRQCVNCGEFFISTKDDIRIKYCPKCSPKSKMSKEKRRGYQKKYRQRKKQEKLAIEREARIENLMEKTGYSREEIIEIIEADLNM